jgi:hypothetical protein
MNGISIVIAPGRPAKSGERHRVEDGRGCRPGMLASGARQPRFVQFACRLQQQPSQRYDNNAQSSREFDHVHVPMAAEPIIFSRSARVDHISGRRFVKKKVYYDLEKIPKVVYS